MKNYRPNSNNLLFCRNNGDLITQGMMNSVIFSAYEDKYDEQQENYLKEQGIGLL